MIEKLNDFSINRKLLLILLFSCILSLLFAGVFLILLEFSEFQRSTREDLTALAEAIGNRSTSALKTDDRNLAAENLAVFNNIPSVQDTCLYNAKNELFVGLANKSHLDQTCPLFIENEKIHFFKKQLVVNKPIIVNKVKVGTVYLRADLTRAYWRKTQFIAYVFLTLVIVSMLTFLISQPLLKLITVPITKLVATVKKIKETGDYSLKAEKLGNDETGVLVDSFNSLIETVDSQSRALRQAKNRYLALYDDNPTMLFNISREGLIISANTTGAMQFGVSVEELQNCSIFDFIDSGDTVKMRNLIENCFAYPPQVYNEELRNICPKGRMLWVKVTARLVENESHESSVLLVYEDITETRLLNAQIVYQADHDALTGLANRNSFDRHLKQAISLAYTDNIENALCYLDLDQFKIINDTCGHLAGDELLRQLGDLLRKNIRQHDFVARLGGDEFGVLMFDCAPYQALRACEKLRDLVKDFTFAWEGRSFTIGVSIGVAAINVSTSNAVELLKEADTACYVAKGNGRNRVHLFSPDDEELTLRQGEMQWVEKIRFGLEQQRFTLYGQPIVPLLEPSDKLHFEVLLRYLDDRGNIIPPGAFLPAAERYNIASELDRWMIAHLLQWLAQHPDFLESLSLCSLNLSGLTLSDESMLKFISEQFKKTGISTQKICFEITETAAITNLSQATHFIEQLKAQGCLFSLDDFGSGLSSFAYLKNLPVDFLKIDGLFVKDILDDEVDLAMVKSINEIGHVMAKKTIAEFVENERVFNLLKSLGVDYAQGYGIGKPVPLSELKLVTPFFKP